MNTITVKGIGKVSARPDYVILSMELSSRHRSYEKAMEIAAESIAQLSAAFIAAGFEKDIVKTTDFYVRTDYKSVQKKDGSYTRAFTGYAVSHSLKAAFDFSSARLALALSAVSSCPASPELSIAFTVKDPAAVNEELLRTATANARRKAEILCAASGKTLSELRSIDYNWGEVNLYSRTSYMMEDRCMAAPSLAADIDFVPDDIDASDTVTFVWEIV